MDKDELKKILKPLIKECIKEVMFESGVLSRVVSEVASGLTDNRQVLAESKSSPKQKSTPSQQSSKQSSAVDDKLNEYKRSFAESVSKDNYGGVDLFEGTQPLSAGGSINGQPGMGPMANIDPGDSGVDIGGLVKVAGSAWNKLANS
jgi:hypothetical protein